MNMEGMVHNIAYVLIMQIPVMIWFLAFQYQKPLAPNIYYVLHKKSQNFIDLNIEITVILKLDIHILALARCRVTFTFTNSMLMIDILRTLWLTSW